MNSYEIYITKSIDAAHLISASLEKRMEQSGYKSIGVAFVSNGCELLPPIYWDRGYFYAVVEYESGSSPEYKLTIC